MKARWPIAFAAAGALAYLGFRYEHGLAHGLGIDTQQSDNYDFVSGVGPMIIAAIGYVSLVTAAIHALNCHHEGCWRVGRHKVNGTPWCNRHHEQARPLQTTDDLLRDLSAKLDALTAAIGAAKTAGGLRRWPGRA